eukprot:TRINITY_DN22167_c0_g2_i1.p1 TRINITY_DN22167_c0_g2~~TRINITY_DN22167_c0_g2_i1.p1  ORF type:complete len:177 (-),score=24.77 TRINITY_DN22167_c0_g2_i1:741-1271(-)
MGLLTCEGCALLALALALHASANIAQQTKVAVQVCFASRSNAYSSFALSVPTTSITLERTQGQLACCQSGLGVGLGNWGSWGKGRKINTWITNSKGQPVAPFNSFHFRHDMYYYPGEGNSCAGPTNSSTLTFHGIFSAGQYQIWYGENLRTFLKMTMPVMLVSTSMLERYPYAAMH